MAKKPVILVNGTTDEQLKIIADAVGVDFDVKAVDIEKFKSENKTLSDSVKEKDLLIADQMKKIKELEDAVPEDLSGVVTELKGVVKEKDLVIESLMAAQEENETEKKVGSPVVSYKKQKYEIVITRFEYNGKVITAAELKKDASLIAELLEAKSGVLKKLD